MHLDSGTQWFGTWATAGHHFRSCLPASWCPGRRSPWSFGHLRSSPPLPTTYILRPSAIFPLLLLPLLHTPLLTHHSHPNPSSPRDRRPTPRLGLTDSSTTRSILQFTSLHHTFITMASRIIPDRLKPSTTDGDADGFSRHHGKTQSHMVSQLFPLCLVASQQHATRLSCTHCCSPCAADAVGLALASRNRSKLSQTGSPPSKQLPPHPPHSSTAAPQHHRRS
ncbi:hypothetical protein JOL62DRAFT_185399 [Phyllosticta paracitricarpa]|uniref:Uncharacterized protein n=1 Tax=Phyllosticta paracitricarpa TaxID=2016321 RepID=A0ABR1N2I5_9PEZI